MIVARLEICDTCPLKKELNPAGLAIVKALNSEGSTYVCGACGCPLASITAAPDYKCKENKWGKWVVEESYS
jgi:hypothetical protein